MKLSELSYREYIAMHVFPEFANHLANYQIAAGCAFDAADAFLKKVGKEYREVAEQRERAEKAETTIGILLNMEPSTPGNFAARVALLEIWDFLGVNNQTAAMEALRARQADRT